MTEEKTFYVDVTITSRTTVTIRATSKTEALKKLRACEWEEQSDQEVYTIRKSSPIVEAK